MLPDSALMRQNPLSWYSLRPTRSSLPAFAARTQFANVFIDIDSRRAASDTPTPSVIASFTV
jgi:hypothetical protein